MQHFRIKYKKKYLYDKYRYYPQYRKNILSPFRYLKKDDIFGLDLSILDDLPSWGDAGPDFVDSRQKEEKPLHLQRAEECGKYRPDFPVP